MAWIDTARALEREALAVYLIARHRDTPWLARVLAACVVGYAFSPIDLIPDVIPVLGLLDDVILVPLGIALVLRFVPEAVAAECRAEAGRRTIRPTSRIGAVVVLVIWIGLGWLLWSTIGDDVVQDA